MSDTFSYSYTHSAEDIFLRRILRDVDPGFFIDVGAYDPVHDSVTKLLYDAGWAGINIEPNPASFERLIAARPRDVNLDIAVSDAPGTMTLNVVSNTGLSTLRQDIAGQHLSDGYQVEKVQVQVSRLDAIWDQHVPKGQPVHFLKIDVEGAEDKVIAGADWTRHRPWVLVIEATLPNSDTPAHKGWEPTVLAAGYQLLHFDGVNRYYLADEHQDLARNAAYPPNPGLEKFHTFGTFLALEHLKERDSQLALANEALAQADATFRQEQEQMNAQLVHLSQRLEDLDRTLAERIKDIHHLNGEIAQRDAALAAKDAALAAKDNQLAHSKKRLASRLFFRSNGRPKKAVRRLLFHTSGQPRDRFSRLVLKKNGTVRPIFRKYIESPDYQKLRDPIRLSDRLPGAAAAPQPAHHPQDPVGFPLPARAQTIRDSLLRAGPTA